MRFKSSFTIPAVAAIGFCLNGATAQLVGDCPGEPCPGGFTGVVDLQAKTGYLHLGIQYVESLDIYWSSARVDDGPHQLFQFDNNVGELNTEVDQIAAAQSSAWGYRDMATDGEFIYAGWETGVARHNLDGTGGTQIIFGGLDGGTWTWRALAYDPTGDGGKGSLWSASFSSPLFETSLTGEIINEFPNSDGWSLYGLAYDPNTGNLWGYASPNLGDVVEIDIQDGSPTEGRQTGLSYDAGCILGVNGCGCQSQGGLTMVPGGAFEYSGIDPFNLVLLGQANSNSILGIRIEPCGPSPCSADIDGDFNVGVTDLLTLLGAWGPCPE